jgi:hypothetical protein
MSPCLFSHEEFEALFKLCLSNESRKLFKDHLYDLLRFDSASRFVTEKEVSSVFGDDPEIVKNGSHCRRKRMVISADKLTTVLNKFDTPLETQIFLCGCVENYMTKMVREILQTRSKNRSFLYIFERDIVEYFHSKKPEDESAFPNQHFSRKLAIR